MKTKNAWLHVAIGLLTVAPVALGEEEVRTIVIPTVFDEGRFIVTPITIDDDTIRLIADTAGGTVMFQESVDRLKLKSMTVASDPKLRVKMPPLLKESWIPGSLEVEGTLIVATKIKQRRMANLATDLDGMLGQSWFAGKVWVFDYPAQKLMVYRQRVLQIPPAAKKLEIGFLRDENGVRQINFPRITVSIGGKSHDMLLETGATAFISVEARRELGDPRSGRRATCFIVQSVFETWRQQHPDWQVVENADIETSGSKKGPMIEVKSMKVAGFEVGPVWFMVRPDPNYHDFTSQWTDKRVDGSVGGNALRDLRVMLDYLKATAWVEKP